MNLTTMKIPDDTFKMYSDKTLKFAQKLIQTPSLSGEEDQVAHLIRSEMMVLGYDEVYLDSAGNVTGIIEPPKPPESNSSVLMFNGHMDHVDPGDETQWKYPPYSGEIADGMLWGRGAADMKAALAAMIVAAGAVKTENLPIRNRLIVSAVVYEEYTEGLGQQIVSEEGNSLGYDLVVLGEGTKLDICIGHRGRCEISILIKGKTSHASMPDLGVNAIYPIKTVLEYIEESRQQYPSDPYAGKESVALTHISCKPGVGPIIPDSCLIKLDRRILPQTKLEDLNQETIELNNRIQTSYPNTHVESQIIEEPVTFYTGRHLQVPQFFPGWIQDPESPIVKTSRDTLSKILDQPPKIITWKFGTDGSYTAGIKGIPTIGFGPSDETQAHVPNEHVRISRVEKALEGYIDLAVDLTGLAPASSSTN